MNQLGDANSATLEARTFADHARALLSQPPG
jgi:hypothetical protein